MGFFRGVGNVLSNLVDVRVDKWIGYDYLKQSMNRSTFLVKQLFKIEHPKFKESFEEAKERLGLDEATLEQRKKEFLRLSITFCFIAFGVFSYSIYLIYVEAFISALIAFLFTFYNLTQAFRFHFWYFQVKNRKLGCSLKEWLSTTFNIKIKEKIRE
jgi:intracellular multiplication protein IcmV